MRRYCKIYAISVVLLLVVQESFAFKGKKEYKKIKDVKSRLNYLDPFSEGVKSEQTRHYYTQQSSQRPIRSSRDAKLRVMLEEPSVQKVQHNHIKVKKLIKPQGDDMVMSKVLESTCGKKLDCGITEKQKQKVSALAMDEMNGRGKNEKKGKAGKVKRLNFEDAEGQRELTPEDMEYRICSRRNLKKKNPVFLMHEDPVAEDLSNEYDTKYSQKTLRNLPPKFFMESENENELEKPSVHSYMDFLEDTIDDSSSYPALNDTEDEYEEDFL